MTFAADPAYIGRHQSTPEDVNAIMQLTKDFRAALVARNVRQMSTLMLNSNILFASPASPQTVKMINEKEDVNFDGLPNGGYPRFAQFVAGTAGPVEEKFYNIKITQDGHVGWVMLDFEFVQEHLGDLLRLSLSSQGRSAIALEEELDFLDHYLAIQKIRFGDNLRVEINVSDEVRRALVPSMFIQPLVENAIRHGLSPRSGGGTIILCAQSVDDKLHIRVLDNGVGLPPDWSPHTHEGLGLSVTRERIAGLHPDASSHFSIHRRPEGGTEVEIYFPFRLTEGIHDRARTAGPGLSRCANARTGWPRRH
jgi:hypothetical protein